MLTGGGGKIYIYVNWRIKLFELISRTVYVHPNLMSNRNPESGFVVRGFKLGLDFMISAWSLTSNKGKS